LRGFVSAVFAKRRCRNNATVSLAEPSAPVRAADVADVGDRLATELRRPGHAPTSHSKLTLAVRPVADDRRHLVGEDPRKQRQVARPIALRAKPIADSGLAFGQAVEVAHCPRSLRYRGASRDWRRLKKNIDATVPTSLDTRPRLRTFRGGALSVRAHTSRHGGFEGSLRVKLTGPIPQIAITAGCFWTADRRSQAAEPGRPRLAALQQHPSLFWRLANAYQAHVGREERAGFENLNSRLSGFSA
jgi:hypothetical protein